jgi:large subunit ribosomal protein L4
MANSRFILKSFSKILNTINCNNNQMMRLSPLLYKRSQYCSTSTTSVTEAPVISSESETLSQESLPLVINREISHLNNVNTNVSPIREVWLENMSTKESIKLSIIGLHPSIFGTFPRIDLIQENHKWQKLYKSIDWRFMKTRAEMPGSGRKPWPQKGTGRARAGSVRAPQFVGGGWAHGPRGPKTWFYMLPFPKRVKGLTSMLSAKLAQDDIRVVDTLETLPSDKSSFIEDLCYERGWGPSVLFVDSSDIFPKNISIATESIKHINLMPVYGLNVHSMLKHETLVLTLAAVQEIESKLLFQLRRTDLKNVIYKHRPSGVLQM